MFLKEDSLKNLNNQTVKFAGKEPLAAGASIVPDQSTPDSNVQDK